MAQPRLREFRAHKDHYFRHGEHSPLTAEQRQRFTGLDYFEEDPALSFIVSHGDDGPGIGEEVDLATTDGTTAGSPALRVIGG